MLVVDASAVAELLLGRPAAERIALYFAEHDFALHAPHLLDVEVLSALRRLVSTGEASAARASGAVEDLLDLPLERYPHDVLVPRVWELRKNFSSYDATYVALAETLTEGGAPLLTSDERLARGARAHTGVEVLEVG
jgi:predicted nucleic acid-binding protein